ncbi:TBC domain-containing protein [Aspergillus saccharolyticus JOP 1030-1]|uniref:TBC-domain-containing protein n=1 Tax=Aspergillus saccharolyticus JOP 1030-1 TaxID=1450539 RepID=A0A319ATK3_9EURO|nr:TBC-domain-containing protein [Aspergillus saccharolyticus JOP 1030-1]PYH49532.1 TBC-domain-containing protein [Aspergillus saccharolyticus JOP 1030-1]
MAECEIPPAQTAPAPTPVPRRSSSRTSSSSRHSQKARTVRARSQKRHSASSSATTTDLTSFPSLSPPDRSVDGFLGQPALNRALTNALLDRDNSLTDIAHTGDTTRDRRATLAKLTSTSSTHSASGRAALFGDSVPIRDFPGALHLADDAHIERLIATTGAVKLVRQFARDLAQRDAEISALRQRADARERELKRMLREVSVSNQDIELRLYALENRPVNPESARDKENGSATAEQSGSSSSSVHGLMQQAMDEGLGLHGPEEMGTEAGPENAQQATVRAPQRSLESDARSGHSSLDSNSNRKRQSSIRSWGDFIFGGTLGSRKTSRASSVMSGADEETQRPRNASNPSGRRKALDDQLFQPPDEPSGPGAAEVVGRRLAAANGDDASVHSRKSSKSLSSWTVKLFAGNAQSSKDEANAEDARGRALSINRDASKAAPPATSAVAALKRINSNVSIQGAPGRSPGPSALSKVSQAGRRQGSSSVSQGASSEAATKNATNLGPVEMDAILPLESRPPTLANIYNNYQSGDLLTDRFGFIYDQSRKRRQREASDLRKAGPAGNRLSIAETLNSLRSEASDGDDGSEYRSLLQSSTGNRSSPASLSPENAEAGAIAVGRWQDYLVVPTAPTELLSHTPSAGPIISLTTAGDTQPRSTAVAIDKRGSVSVSPNAQPSASTSAVVADRPEFAGLSSDESAALAANENEPVKLLLEQLTDLHDSLQRDRTVRWNEFLRKVRAERRKDGEAAAAAAAASDRPLQSVDTPEASLADGEMVGISGLGNKGKVGRAKWREFRALVLGGIPVALRAKIWSECSGASSMRVPGYYGDLVRGIGGTDPDPSVVSQIEMDINRTLTDNVFFRKGPGVEKLKEVLLAYSRRNPEVGYCQGMNLIAASLLLVTPTAEDTFWLLASMIEVILPEHYYDHGLLASRADQVVLRRYISEVLPKLSAHLESLNVELEALTFQWFLSVFTDCLSAEALYRVWDVVLCLNVTSSFTPTNASASTVRDSNDANSTNATNVSSSGNGGGSTFLFQVALALLKLNEQQLLTTCSTPAELYTYINHQMTNHAISIDGLIQASDALRNVIRREEVVARRADALREMQEFPGGRPASAAEDTGSQDA